MAEGRAKGRSWRDRIWEYIRSREQLGMLTQPVDVSTALGISKQALQYHVKVMERAGILVRWTAGHTLHTRPRPSDSQPGQKAVVTPGDPGRMASPRYPRAAMRDRIVAATLLLFVRIGRWPTQAELRAELDLSASALRGYLVELEREGRVERLHGGRAIFVPPPNGGAGS